MLTMLICGYVGGCFWSQSWMDSPHTPLPSKEWNAIATCDTLEKKKKIFYEENSSNTH